MPIPNKGFFDPEPIDSVQHHQDRASAIREQMAADAEEQERKNAQYKIEEEKRQAAARENEVSRLQDLASLSRDQMTRDMILDRIREMRAEKPPEYEPPPRTPEQQAIFEKEQADGRAAVAKAEAAQQAHRELAAKLQATQEVTKTIVHPNPSQSEIFPTV